MFPYILAACAAFAAALLATPVVRELARHYGIVDSPDGFRKTHAAEIPLAGGYAILFAFAVPAALMLLADIGGLSQLLSGHERSLVTLGLGAVVVVLMGGLDDICNLKPRWKFLFQIVAATFAYFGGFAIGRVSLPFGGALDLGIFSYPVTLFWFLGCMNAINFLDGLDGLAAGVGLFTSITIGLVSLLLGHHFCLFLSLCLAGAILGFLIYNFNPASVFLGDAGSMLIGFLLGGLSVIGSIKAEATVALLIPFTALGLPVLDTGLAILRRWSHRLPLAAADRKHIHHTLLSLGLSHRSVVLTLYSFCLALGGVALLITAGRSALAVFFLASLALIASVSTRVFGIVDFHAIYERVRSDWEERRRGGLAGLETEKRLHAMNQASSANELWEQAIYVFSILQMSRAAAEISLNGKKWTFSWANSNPQQHPSHQARHGYCRDEWNVTLNLFDNKHVFGSLALWRCHEELPIRDTCSLINRLRHAFATNLVRLYGGQTTETPGKSQPTVKLANARQ